VNYAIVFVSDMARSVAFYRDALGLPLKFQSIGWSEFATDGATLALHLSGAAAQDDPRRISPGHCRPGLRVADLDDFHKRATENRVTCVQEPKEQFGIRIAQYADPDGLVISVSEGRSANEMV
jgi:lactoylglutathione lyase